MKDEQKIRREDRVLMGSFKEERAAMRQRAIHALAFVVVVVGGILGICAQASIAEGERWDGVFAEEVWSGLDSGLDSLDCLQRSGFIVTGTEDVPDWMQEEVMDPQGHGMWAANDDWSILGIVKEGSSADEVIGEISDDLISHGWHRATGQPSGSSDMQSNDGHYNGGASYNGDPTLEDADSQAVTFTKKGGTCRWIMLTGVQVGEAASVVLRIQHV